MLDRAIEQYGKVYLLDLHSFLGLITDDVCLGNVNGKSCSEFFIATVEHAFSARDLKIVRNKVFNGGYIVRNYGQPPQVEALQIELRYPVYLNSQELDRPIVPSWQLPEFDRAKHTLKNVFTSLCDRIYHHDQL